MGAEEVEGRRCCWGGRKALHVVVEGGMGSAGVAERSLDPPGYSDASSPPWQLVQSGVHKEIHVNFSSVRLQTQLLKYNFNKSLLINLMCPC